MTLRINVCADNWTANRAIIAIDDSIEGHKHSEEISMDSDMFGSKSF